MTHEGMVTLERKPGCSQGQREPAGSPQPSAVLTGRGVTGTQLPKTKGPSDLDRPQSYRRGIVQSPRTPAALGPGPESAPTCPGRGGRRRERKRKARRGRGSGTTEATDSPFPECRLWPPWGSDPTTWGETLQLAVRTLRAREARFHSRAQI